MATAIEVIANHYGYQEQSRMLMEECAELIQAVNKYHRHPRLEHLDGLYEEMADVTIMIEQMRHLLKQDHRFTVAYEFKIQRQLERIRKEKEHEAKIQRMHGEGIRGR